MTEEYMIEQDEVTSLNDTDIFLTTVDLAGTPLSKIISWANIKSLIKTYIMGSVPLASGTYTATITGVTNVDAASQVADLQYSRVGNIVSVAGHLLVDATAAAQTVVSISLPIASTLAAAQDVNGNGSAQATNTIGTITGDVATATARLFFVATNTASQNWRVMFMYIIK